MDFTGNILFSTSSQVKFSYFLACAEDWKDIEVVYKSLPGWATPIFQIRKFDDLPKNCRDYVEFIEQFIGVPVRWIGVGEDREALIVRN